MQLIFWVSIAGLAAASNIKIPNNITITNNSTAPQNFSSVYTQIINYPPTTIEMIPQPLTFVEELQAPLKPSNVLVFTGTDNPADLEANPFIQASVKAVQELCETNGYQFTTTWELAAKRPQFKMNKLRYRNTEFAPYWLRLFAMPFIRRLYREVKYIVWIDADILVTYPQTHTFNRLIRILNETRHGLFLFSEDPLCPLNSGIMIMRNVLAAYRMLQDALDVGVEDERKWNLNRFHEQDAFAKLKDLSPLNNKKIMVIPRFNKNVNLNAFHGECTAEHSTCHWAGKSTELRNLQMPIEYERSRAYVKALINSGIKLPLPAPIVASA